MHILTGIRAHFLSVSVSSTISRYHRLSFQSKRQNKFAAHKTTGLTTRNRLVQKKKKSCCYDHESVRHRLKEVCQGIFNCKIAHFQRKILIWFVTPRLAGWFFVPHVCSGCVEFMLVVVSIAKHSLMSKLTELHAGVRALACRWEPTDRRICAGMDAYHLLVFFCSHNVRDFRTNCLWVSSIWCSGWVTANLYQQIHDVTYQMLLSRFFRREFVAPMLIVLNCSVVDIHTTSA